MTCFVACLGPSTARAIHALCGDIWRIDIDASEARLPAALVFDRFHLKPGLHYAVDGVRGQAVRHVEGAEKAGVQAYPLPARIGSCVSLNQKIIGLSRTFCGTRVLHVQGKPGT